MSKSPDFTEPPGVISTVLAPRPLTLLADAIGCLAYNRLIRRRLTNFQALTGCGLDEVLELGRHRPAILFFRAIDQYITQQKAT